MINKKTMKMRNKLQKLLLLGLLLFIIPLSMSAQDKILVTGVVIDDTDEPLIGVSIIVKGNPNESTITDIDGNFSLSVSKGATLVFSYIGFSNKEIVVSTAQRLNVLMEINTQLLNTVEVVGYGTQKRNAISGAISSVKSDDLLKSPTGSLSSSVAGRVPGILVKQSTGQPGEDKADIKIRGISTFSGSSEPLVLVDGIERSYNSIDPEEVESFTVLKDAASTAVYGVRGGNGVILITTKRGKVGKPQVSYSGNVALQTPTRLPKVANSYDYARYYNQAYLNDGNLGSYYSDSELQKYKDHSDPIFYPDVDWMDQVFNKVSVQHKHNVNVTGGTQFTRYYVSLGYFNQQGLQKNVSKAYDYNNTDGYSRINLRSNVDMTITPTTQLGVTLGVNNSHKRQIPNSSSGEGLFMTVFKTPANYTPGYVNGKYIFLNGNNRNPLYNLTTGLKDIYDNHLDVAVELSQNLNFITDGLTLKGKIAYDDNYAQMQTRSKTEQYFQPLRSVVNGEEVILFKPMNDAGLLGGASNDFANRSKRIYLETSLQYSHSFARDHNVSALLLMNSHKTRYKMDSYNSVATGYIEYVGRAAYNFREKYLAEFNMGINGSENFAKGQRYGYFPAFSGGWVATNEEFVKSAIPATALSFLKIRASYGEVGNDQNGSRRFFYYPQTYTQTGDGDKTYWFGENPTKLTEYQQGAQTNANVTWETSQKQNYAIETRFFSDKLFLNFDYFIEKRNDILTTMNSTPFYTGFESATYNIGKTENKGFELEGGWSQQLTKDFSYYIKGNYSFARNKVIYKDEVLDYNNPQKWETGRRIGEKFGYVFAGYFQSQDEIDAWPDQFGVTLRPGDVKYVDVNGDGKVDTNDIVPLMNPDFPEINYGISGGFTYRNIDMSFLFQGAGNVSLTLGGAFQKPFEQLGTIFEHSFDSWSLDNPDAAYPRLSVTHSQTQNYNNSTIWIKDASYLRFKNFELGYTFNKSQLSKLKFISSIRIFTNAQNICVWDHLNGITDPENKANADGINYPQQRVFNIGANIRF